MLLLALLFAAACEGAGPLPLGPYASEGGAGSDGKGDGSDGKGDGKGDGSDIVREGTIGQSCEGDDDCAAGEYCGRKAMWQDHIRLRTKAGYCSKHCDSDSECPGGSECKKKGVQTGKGKKGTCVVGCVEGPALQTIDEMPAQNKCRGRTDLVCRFKDCETMCTRDDDCPPSYRCERRHNWCVEDFASKVGPKQDGTACDEDSDCKGDCVKATQYASSWGWPQLDLGSLCTTGCVLGGPESCYGNDACVPQKSEYGAGDPGACMPRCQAHDDCRAPRVCHRFARTSGQTDADDDAHCRTAQTCSQPSEKRRSGPHHGECATSERCFASELVFGKLERTGVAGVCLQVDAESCDADGAGCEPLLTFE